MGLFESKAWTYVSRVFWPWGGSSGGMDYPDDNPARAGRPPTWEEMSYAAGVTRSGIPYSDDLAVTITAVYRAVQLVASTIAALPLKVYERQADGSRLARTYAEDAYLWDRPNPEQSAVTFWEQAFGHEVLNGNAFLWVEANREGLPMELWPLEPRRVRVYRDDDGIKRYQVDGGAEEYRDFRDGGDIVHVPGWGYDGLTGLSPIRQFAQTIGLASASEEFAARLFVQGALHRGILQTDQQLDPAVARELSERFTVANRGLVNAHRTAVLDRGLKWQATSINPEDAQMLATRQFQVAEIARMFGVPEHLIGSHDKQSSWGSGLEVNTQAFLVFTLQPHMIRFEQAINDALLGAGRYVKWETSGLLRGTANERANFYERMQRIGAYSVNDILELEDRPRIGAEGDVRLIPLNVGRLDQVGQSPAGEPVDQAAAAAIAEAILDAPLRLTAPPA